MLSGSAPASPLFVAAQGLPLSMSPSFGGLIPQACTLRKVTTRIVSVWAIGSYDNSSGDPSTTSYTEQLTRLLGRALAAADVSLVCGESDVLHDLCAEYRGATQPDSLARAIMIHGSMRTPAVFRRHLKRTPTAVLVLVGGHRSRSLREIEVAKSLGLEVAGFAETAGVVNKQRSLFDAVWSQEDPSDAVQEAIAWVRRKR